MIEIANKSSAPPWVVDPKIFREEVPRVLQSDLQPALRPRPPRIPDPSRYADRQSYRDQKPKESTLLYQTHFVGLWYQSWVKATYGETHKTGENARFSSWKNWPVTAGGVAILVANRVRPVEWFSFVEKVRRNSYLKSGVAPTFSSAVHCTFVRNHVHEFARDQSGKFMPRLISTPAYRELAVKTSEMERELARRRPSTRAALRAVVQQHFPGREHARLLSRAKFEADQAQEQCRRDIENFQWVWDS